MTNRNGKTVLHDFVITATAEHFVTVRAVDPDQARKRGLRALEGRWGVGRNITITEVEVLAHDDTS
jgi:hypothetical protein